MKSYITCHIRGGSTSEGLAADGLAFTLGHPVQEHFLFEGEIEAMRRMQAHAQVHRDLEVPGESSLEDHEMSVYREDGTHIFTVTLADIPALESR